MQKVKKTRMKAVRDLDVNRLSIALLSLYCCLVVMFYFLAGEQLHYRQSRGNIEVPVADSAVTELTQGVIVEQTFSAPIQRLKQITVQWGTYYRPNTGSVAMELYNDQTGELILSKQISAADIFEGQLISMQVEGEPIESVYNVPLRLRLYSSCVPGAAVAPMMSAHEQRENSILTVNGVEMQGILCFSASGEDYIWTGIHYWKLAFVGLLLVGAGLFFLQIRIRQGKHSYLLNAIIAVERYEFLIRQLVSRDFKTKYKRSVLGVFWSFLNPLLTMLVQYFVFSNLFQSDIPYYPAYLLIGIVSFNFFNEACNMCLTSVLGNASLIKKVYMPKYIYPLTRLMSSVINFAIALIPLVIVSLLTGVRFKKAAVLALFFWFCLIVFSLGLGMLLSAAMVFFRDTQFLWGVFSMIWMYATPIFYPESILPEQFRGILQINPIYHFLKNSRMCILEGLSPEPIAYLQCLGMALVTLVVGAVVFRKSQDKFVLYL